ncbi:GNAT family N-acetyltransferase [Sulfitobacter aestuarii]|uniref:GNAT family N-acetyltransferase n=1 Tax=Sulfitobacter aestuarii TaxID=2161676 RepID=A0ABW5U2B8_9RHOB
MSTLTLPHPRPLIRGAAPWREVLLKHYTRLGAASRRLRFLGGVADSGLRRLAGETRPASVLGIELDGQVRGVLEIFPVSQGAVEIGISVEDAYQGRGIGRRLFTAGLREAERLGAAQAVFLFHTSNAGIHHLVSSAGARITVEGDESRARVDLSQAVQRHGLGG